MKTIFQNFMPNIPYDKKLHFIAGFLIAFIFCFVFSPIDGIGLAIIAGIFKECYDDYSYGMFDIFDMLVTWLGGCVGFTLFSLVKYFAQ